MPWITLPDWRYFLKPYFCVYEWTEGYYQRLISLAKRKSLAVRPQDPVVQKLQYDEILKEGIVVQPKTRMMQPRYYTPYYDMQRQTAQAFFSKHARRTWLET